MRKPILLRTLERLGPGGPIESKRCEVDGCSERTREGKPYCLEHVDRHSYVQSLLATMAKREAAEARVRRRGAGAVDPNSLTAQEILLQLKLHGGRTVERLSRDLQLEADLILCYVQGLRRRGLLTVGMTVRNKVVAFPAERDASRKLRA